MGKLTLIIGPMFSSKTTTLISKLERYKLTGKKTLLIKYIGDKRYTTGDELISHSSYTFKPDLTIYAASIKKLIDEYDTIESYDIIAIDEGQFFPDIVLANQLANSGHIVYISALNGTSQKENFNGFEKIYPFVDDIIYLTAICMVCKGINGLDASFTKKISNDNTNVIDIGGSDKYVSVCRFCF